MLLKCNLPMLTLCRCCRRVITTSRGSIATRVASTGPTKSRIVGGRSPSRWKSQPCMAIRRETINAWERRAPLAPKHVRQMVKDGVKVLVQPSNRRAYPIQEYINAGAIAKEDISEASLIMSVKGVPIDNLLPNKTYVFFSHTIKAQRDNMPLLDAILQRNIRLIDYEKMVDERGQRYVAFGKWAGYAGMIDILHGLGLRLLALGHHTPFLHIGLAHNYRDSHMAQNAIRDAGYEIALGLMPRSVGPLTFAFTGSGNVSQGAQEIFQQLPHEYVEVQNLAKVAQHGSYHKVYGCVVSRDDHLVRVDGGRFDPVEYDTHPERYKSMFAQNIAKYTSVLINGIYWAPNSPRLITLSDAKFLLAPHCKTAPDIPGCPTLPHRLLAICDISADPGGSIEFMTECTTIDRPFNMYDADMNRSHDSLNAPVGMLVCSIDNMPAQMPLEATKYFGDLLLPYVYEMLESDAEKPFEQFQASPVVKNAVIVSNGRLTQNFEYIAELRRQHQLQSAHKTGKLTTGHHSVLVLGAGYVSGPTINYLCRSNDCEVTVATSMQEDVERLLRLSPNVRTEILDVRKDVDKLESLINIHDVVISLLPYDLHPAIAKMCINNKTDMVTASYQSPQMLALHNSALEAGITVVNEAGLDPGIDHFLAMDCIDSVHEKGGKVFSFVSFCGGLPSPECSENPIRYKFNWSPRGVLMNVLSSAKYIKNGQLVEVAPGGSILDTAMDVEFMPGFHLEGFPNRDSTVYGPLYRIPSAETLFRGTLRYSGFTEAMKALMAVGLLDSNYNPAFDPDIGPNVTWKNLLATLLHQNADVFVESLKSLTAERLGPTQYRVLNDLDLFSEDSVVTRKRTPLDTLCQYLQKKLSYHTGERDVVILRHDIGVHWQDNSQSIHHVDFVAYGDSSGHSAMASTVGYTAAIVAQMILNGEIREKGMVLPMTKDIYRPVLKRLEPLGFVAKAHSTKL